MKRILEVNDVLDECVEEATEEVTRLLREHLEANPDTDELPNLSNDLDYSGSVHEVIDSAVPVYDCDIDAIFFLHGDKVEAAFDNVGFGNKTDKGWPRGWKPAAVFTYIEQEVHAWWRNNAQDIFDKWQEAKAATTEDADE